MKSSRYGLAKDKFRFAVYEYLRENRVGEHRITAGQPPVAIAPLAPCKQAFCHIYPGAPRPHQVPMQIDIDSPTGEKGFVTDGAGVFMVGVAEIK